MSHVNTSSPAVLRKISGAGLVGSSSGKSVQSELNIRAGMQMSPEDFGAVGDGVADDTEAWQLLLDSCASIVCIAGSVYSISDELIVPSNRFINLNNAEIVQTVDQKVIFDADLTDRVQVWGGKLQGKSEASFVNSSVSRSVAIKASGASRLVVHHCDFNNFWYSPLSILTKAYGVAFCNNRISGPGAAVLGVDINRRNCTGATICADYLIAANNDIYDTAQGLIVVESSSHVLLDSNHIHDIINEHGIYVDTSVNHLTVMSNVIARVDGNGIKVQNYTSAGGTSTNILITGNNIHDVAAVGGDAIIVYNSVPDVTPLYSENVLIESNIINGVDIGNGINVRHCKNIAVSGNTINHCLTANSIFFSYCEKIKFENNRIDGSYQSAIYGTNSTGLCVESNEIRNPATGGFATNNYGIYLTDMTDIVIRNNDVYGLTADTRYCLFVASGDQSTWSIYDNRLVGAKEYALRLGGSTALREFYGNYLSGVLDKSYNGWPSIASVASAANLLLPNNQKVIRVTGATNISSIGTSGHSGAVVTLLFDSALTVVRGSNLQIVSNFVTTSQDTLTLACDGNYWYEMTRAVN